jgi:hypothetical protein
MLARKEAFARNHRVSCRYGDGLGVTRLKGRPKSSLNLGIRQLECSYPRSWEISFKIRGEYYFDRTNDRKRYKLGQL